MNMTISELLVKLKQKELLTEYDDDGTSYVTNCLLFIDGDSIGGFDMCNADITSNDPSDWTGVVIAQDEYNFGIGRFSLVENEVVSVGFYVLAEL